MRCSTSPTIFSLPTKTAEPSRSRVTKISSLPVGASLSISPRVRPSSAPASRTSTPGPISVAISGTTSARGDWPIVTSPTTELSAFVMASPLAAERAGGEVDRQREERGVEHERDDAVHSDGATDLLAADGHV